MLATVLIIGIFQIKVYYENEPINGAKRSIKKLDGEIAKKFEETEKKVKENDEKDEKDEVARESKKIA